MRSALDLESPVDWRRALCRLDPDAWFPNSWNGQVRAAHACGHCPVLAACRRELPHMPESRRSGAVVAGVVHNGSGKPFRWPLPPVRCHRCWQPKAAKSLEARLREVSRA